MKSLKPKKKVEKNLRRIDEMMNPVIRKQLVEKSA